MTRKTVLFFCCFAAIMVGPAWAEGKEYIYKCPAGQYAVGSELTSGEEKCPAGFSDSTQVVYPVPSNGVACKSCPNVYFAKPKDENRHNPNDDCIVIGKGRCWRNDLDNQIECLKICLAGTTNRNRYRPAVQKNCYLQGGSRQYEDEMGYFTLSGNCYYTGEYNQK